MFCVIVRYLGENLNITDYTLIVIRKYRIPIKICVKYVKQCYRCFSKFIFDCIIRITYFLISEKETTYEN